MSKNSVRRVTRGAVIAGLYVILTLLSALFGLSGGAVQCRLSEALNVLALSMPEAVPGLAVGCFLSGLVTGANVFDLLFGSLATLLGALGAYALRKRPYTALACPVAANMLIIPFVLKYAYGFAGRVWFFVLTVGAGELLAVYPLGLLLRRVLPRDGRHL